MDDREIDRIRVLAAQFDEDQKREGYSLCTRAHRRWGLNYFYGFLKTRDEVNVQAITGETFYQYQTRLFHMEGLRGKPLSLASQWQALMSVRVFFQWMTRRGEVLADPTTGVRLPKLRETLPRGIMTRREMEKVLAAPNVDTAVGLHDRALMEVLYSTGIRNSEVRHLAVGDVDVREGEMRIRCGKGGKDRMVPLGEIAGKYVELYIKTARPNILDGNPDPDRLFLGRKGKTLSLMTLSLLIKRYVRMAGVTKAVTPHSFRHTCATHMLRGRAGLRHIQEMLGHKSLSTTQIYTRVEVGDLKRELKRCHPREQVK